MNGCGLPRSVHTEQGKEFPLPDFQIQIVNCQHLFILFGKVYGLYGVHPIRYLSFSFYYSVLTEKR